jgi:hypothetical protein
VTYPATRRRRAWVYARKRLYIAAQVSVRDAVSSIARRSAVFVNAGSSLSPNVRGHITINIFAVQVSLQVIDSKDGEMSEWSKEHAGK